MTNRAIDPAEDALYERVRLLIFSADLPVQRLEGDVDDIARYSAPGAPSPHRRLIEAMPPLTPAAEAIVRTTIRAYGGELFRGGNAGAALRALVTSGPVRFAQTALMLGPDAPVPDRSRPLVAAFNRIFERHPESGFAQARCLLARIGLPAGRRAIRGARP